MPVLTRTGGKQILQRPKRDRERGERESERESFIRNNLHNGVVCAIIRQRVAVYRRCTHNFFVCVCVCVTVCVCVCVCHTLPCSTHCRVTISRCHKHLRASQGLRQRYVSLIYTCTCVCVCVCVRACVCMCMRNTRDLPVVPSRTGIGYSPPARAFA